MYSIPPTSSYPIPPPQSSYYPPPSQTQNYPYHYPPPIQHQFIPPPAYYNYPPPSPIQPHYTYTSTSPHIPPIPPPQPIPSQPFQQPVNPTTERSHIPSGGQEPYIRTPSVDLPLFFGDNALSWIEECESIFQLTGITNDSKVKWANAHIRGKAKTWMVSIIINLYLLNWTQFCDLICDRFPAPGEHESME
jgi:hypothetical protein